MKNIPWGGMDILWRHTIYLEYAGRALGRTGLSPLL